MQQTDPWARTTSPPVDPWNPVLARPAPPVGGPSNVESWLSRTQSPSVNSGSSAEGWLHNNGSAANNGTNGNAAASGVTDPWLSKPPAQQPVQDSWLRSSVPPADTWLPPNGGAEGKPADPWAPTQHNMGVIYHTVPNAQRNDIHLIIPHIVSVATIAHRCSNLTQFGL